MFEFISILLVGIAGGLVPLYFKWGDRQHHLALAFSTGIFLGAVFLHLLPSVAAAGAGHDDHPSHAAVSEAGIGDHAAEFAARQAELAEKGEAADPHAGHDHAADDHAGHDHDADDHSGHDHSAHDHSAPDHSAPDHAAHDHAAHDHAGHDHGSETEADPHAGHAHGDIGPWLWVLIGLLGVFLIEAVLIPGDTHGHGHAHSDQDRHSAVGWAALVGLTVHALTAGIALAAVENQADIAGVMLLAILAHKGFESFSLASVFSMTGTKRANVVVMVIAFSLVTPLGLLAGSQISGLLGDGGISILTSLATGTFLYVCLCELLPEVFHHREDGPWKVSLLIIGIALMWYVHQIGGV